MSNVGAIELWNDSTDPGSFEQGFGRFSDQWTCAIGRFFLSTLPV